MQTELKKFAAFSRRRDYAERVCPKDCRLCDDKSTANPLYLPVNRILTKGLTRRTPPLKSAGWVIAQVASARYLTIDSQLPLSGLRAGK
jgi:hypothetical protein